MQARPAINLNFNDPAVQSLKAFVDLIQKKYANEPNFRLAVRLLHCLMYIKLNLPFIEYAVANWSDLSLYKFGAADMQKGVLRYNHSDGCDMSFHINDYKNPGEATDEYSKLFVDIETGIQQLSTCKYGIELFIAKIKDSDVGCMEERLRPAREFLQNLRSRKFEDLMHVFNIKLMKKKLDIENDRARFVNLLSKEFSSEIGTLVVVRKYLNKDARLDFVEEPQILTWEMILNFLEEVSGVDIPSIFQLDDIFDHSVAAETNREFYLFELYFDNYVIARFYSQLIEIKCRVNKIQDRSLKSFLSYTENGSAGIFLTQARFYLLLINAKKNISDIFIIKSLNAEMNQLFDMVNREDIEAIVEKLRKCPVLALLHDARGYRLIHYAVLKSPKLLSILVDQFHVDVNVPILISGTENDEKIHGHTPLIHLIKKAANEEFVLQQIGVLSKNASLDLSHTTYNSETARSCAESRGFSHVLDCLTNIADRVVNQSRQQKDKHKIKDKDKHGSDFLVPRLSLQKRLDLNQDYNFSSYLKDTGELPTVPSYRKFQREIRFCRQKQKNLITPLAKQAVKDRYFWSQLVSSTHVSNQRYLAEHDLKKKIFSKFIRLGYTSDVEGLLSKCLCHLTDHTVVTYTFKASLLYNIQSSVIQNAFQNKVRPDDYLEIRRQKENNMFRSILPPNLMKIFETRAAVRPRYAALFFQSPQQTVRPSVNYGECVIVFKDIIKLNALFVPYNVFASSDNGGSITPCTASNMIIMLSQFTDFTLKALIHWVQTGELPTDYTQYKIGAQGCALYYPEVYFGNVNIFNPDLVESIHIPSCLSAEVYQYFCESRIPVKNEHGEVINRGGPVLPVLSNGPIMPQTLVEKELFHAARTNDSNEFARLIQDFPSCLGMVHAKLHELLEIVAAEGNVKILDSLFKIAVKAQINNKISGHVGGNLLLGEDIKKTVVNELVNQPIFRKLLWIACRDGHEHVLDYLLQQGVSPDLAQSSASSTLSQGLPVAVAAENGHSEMVVKLARAYSKLPPKNATPMQGSIKTTCLSVILKCDVNALAEYLRSYPIFNFNSIESCKEILKALAEANDVRKIQIVSERFQVHLDRSLGNKVIESEKQPRPIVQIRHLKMAVALTLQDFNADYPVAIRREFLKLLLQIIIAMKSHKDFDYRKPVTASSATMFANAHPSNGEQLRAAIMLSHYLNGECDVELNRFVGAIESSRHLSLIYKSILKYKIAPGPVPELTEDDFEVMLPQNGL